MTAYNKPGWITRSIYNPIAKRFGLGSSQALVLQGRTTGKPQSIPVTPVELDGTTYLVSVRGVTEWVRNLEAAGSKGALVAKGHRRDFTARALDVPERAPVIAAYRAKVGKLVDPLWSKLPDDADHPVYALTF